MPCFEVAYIYLYAYYNLGSAGLQGCLTSGKEDDSGHLGRRMTGWLSGYLGLAVWGRPGSWEEEELLGICIVPKGRQSGRKL